MRYQVYRSVSNNGADSYIFADTWRLSDQNGRKALVCIHIKQLYDM